MTTELIFLMELFLDEELPKTIKLKIKNRVQEMSESLTRPAYIPATATITGAPLQFDNPVIAKQSPSMQRLMMNNPDLVPKPPAPTSPAAAQALAARQALINGAANEKPENGRNGPRKI